MGRFARSIELAKQSFRVLKDNPQLVLFPIVSGIATLLVLGSFAVPVILYFIAHQQTKVEHLDAVWYLGSFAFYVISYFVVIFFNSGLVWCSHEILSGRPATFKQGIAEAGRNIGRIALWALVAGTVGMLLRTLSERVGIIGRIVVGLMGGVWSILTYFVVPVLVMEKTGPFKAIKESTLMLRKTWGEGLIGNFSINTLFSLLGMLCIVPFVGAVVFAINQMFVLALISTAVAVIYIMIICVISSSVAGIYQTALYMYGSTGSIPGQFSTEYIQYAFTQKPASKVSRFLG